MDPWLSLALPREVRATQLLYQCAHCGLLSLIPSPAANTSAPLAFVLSLPIPLVVRVNLLALGPFAEVGLVSYFHKDIKTAESPLFPGSL